MKKLLMSMLISFLLTLSAFAGGVKRLATNQVQVTITPAELEAMTSGVGYVTLVSAQGPGTMILVQSVYVDLEFPSSGGVAYTTGTGDLIMSFFAGDQIPGTIFKSALIKYPGSTLVYTAPTSIEYDFPDFDVDSDLLLNTSTNVKYKNGNSNIVVTVNYDVVNAS